MHCVKNVRVRKFSGPYPVRMQENTGKKNSEYGQFFRIDEHLDAYQNFVEVNESSQTKYKVLSLSENKDF